MNDAPTSSEAYDPDARRPLSLTRVLVVEDEDVIGEWIMDRLKDLGIKNVDYAENGQAGYNTLVRGIQSKAIHHLILSDWSMPKMTGLEFLEKIRANPYLEEIPFVFVTAMDQKKYVVEAARLGVTGYIVKPFDEESFDRKVLDILHELGMDTDN